MIIPFLVLSLCLSCGVAGVLVYLNWALGRSMLAIYRHEADPELATAALSMVLGPGLRGQAVLFDEGGRASLQWTSDVLQERFGVTSSQGATLPTSQIAGVARANILELLSRSTSKDRRASQELSQILACVLDCNTERAMSAPTERLSLLAVSGVRMLLHRAAHGDEHALAALERLDEVLKAEVSS